MPKVASKKTTPVSSEKISIPAVRAKAAPEPSALDMLNNLTGGLPAPTVKAKKSDRTTIELKDELAASSLRRWVPIKICAEIFSALEASNNDIITEEAFKLFVHEMAR